MSVESEMIEALANDVKEDRFVFDFCGFELHFPCAACTHREQPTEECCKGCRYYWL